MRTSSVRGLHSVADASKRPCAATSGFSLVELLVVIGIIAVLIALLFPMFAKVRESAQQTACASNLREIFQSCMVYAVDYNGVLPVGCNNPSIESTNCPYTSSTPALNGPTQYAALGSNPPYIQDALSEQLPARIPYPLTGYAPNAVWDCPAVTLPMLTANQANDYFYNAAWAAGNKLTNATSPTDAALFWDFLGDYWAGCIYPHFPELGAADYNDGGGSKINVVYADGHVDSLTASQLIYSASPPSKPYLYPWWYTYYNERWASPFWSNGWVQ